MDNYWANRTFQFVEETFNRSIVIGDFENQTNSSVFYDHEKLTQVVIGLYLFIFASALVICCLASIASILMALFLFWKAGTLWRRRETLDIAEDGMIISQGLLSALHSAVFGMLLLWKAFPTTYFPQSLSLGPGLKDVAMEASLSSIFLVPFSFPVSALLPYKCRPVYVFFSERKWLAASMIWAPWVLLLLLMCLPDLGDWTLLYLLPMLALLCVQFLLMSGYILRCPPSLLDRLCKKMAGVEGPILAGIWHYGRWMVSLAHFLWSVTIYLPVVILLLTLPSNYMALAVALKIFPVVLYVSGATFLTGTLVATRLVHHCPDCVKNRPFFSWCPSHSSYCFKRVFLMQARLRCAFNERTTYRRVIDIDDIASGV